MGAEESKKKVRESNREIDNMLRTLVQEKVSDFDTKMMEEIRKLTGQEREEMEFLHVNAHSSLETIRKAALECSDTITKTMLAGIVLTICETPWTAVIMTQAIIKISAAMAEDSGFVSGMLEIARRSGSPTLSKATSGIRTDGTKTLQ